VGDGLCRVRKAMIARNAYSTGSGRRQRIPMRHSPGRGIVAEAVGVTDPEQPARLAAVALQWKRRFWYGPLIYGTGIVDA